MIFTPNNVQGIMWMLVRCFLFSLLALAYSKGTKGLPVFEVFFLSMAVRLVLVLLWSGATKANIKTKNPRFFVFRASVTVWGHLLWIYALSIISINQATAVSYVAPLFTTTIAIFFFKEHITLKRILAIIAGFIGVMVVLRPDVNGIGYGESVVLGMALIWATTDTIIKMQTSTETISGQLFNNTLLMTAIVAPLAMAVYIPPTPEEWFWLVLAGFLSTLNNVTIFISYGKGDLSVVSPFTFTRIVFTAVMAYIILGDVPTMYQFIGSAIIVASSVYITHLERKKKKLSLA